MESYVRTHKMIFDSISPNISKVNLYKEKCYVGVSMLNNFYWEDRSIVFWEWINKRFESCKIIIGDYIDRHNELNFHNDINLAKSESLIKGKKMLSHLSKFEILKKKKFQFHHWLEFYNEESKIHQTCLDKIYQTNSAFSKSINRSSTKFIERNIRKFEGKNLEKISENSINYILEELSVFCVLIENGYRVQIYPGEQLDILKQLANRKLEIQTPLQKGVYIDLRTKKLKI